MTNEELVAAIDSLRRERAELAERQKELESELASRLVDKDWRYGDTLFRYSRPATTKVVDPGALADWLGDDYRHVVPLTASTQIRKTALWKVASDRGMDPELVDETFLEVTFGEPRLVEMPVSKAPAFAAQMKPGEYRPKRKERTE